MNEFNISPSIKYTIHDFHESRIVNFPLIVYSSYNEDSNKIISYIRNNTCLNFLSIDLFECPNIGSILPITRSPSLFYYNKFGSLVYLDIPSAIYRWLDKQDKVMAQEVL